MANNQEETVLLSTNDYDDEDLVRLIELQRRQAELRDAHMEEYVLDEEEYDNYDDDDFSVTGMRSNNNKKGPTIPDMRFEKQFEKSVLRLKEEGASNWGIIWSAIIKEQIITPFLSGFTWNICAVAWKWYRLRGVVNAKQPGKGIGLFRGISDYTKTIYNVFTRNAALLLTTTAQAVEADHI